MTADRLVRKQKAQQHRKRRYVGAGNANQEVFSECLSTGTVLHQGGAKPLF